MDTITNRVKSEKETREYYLERARRERAFGEARRARFTTDQSRNRHHESTSPREIVKGIDKYYDNVEKATKMKAEKESGGKKSFRKRHANRRAT